MTLHSTRLRLQTAAARRQPRGNVRINYRERPEKNSLRTLFFLSITSEADDEERLIVVELVKLQMTAPGPD